MTPNMVFASQRRKRVLKLDVVLKLAGRTAGRDLTASRLRRDAKIRVPDTFQVGAISDARAFCASRKINKFRVFNNPEYSDSHRRYHFKARLIHRQALRNLRFSHRI